MQKIGWTAIAYQGMLKMCKIIMKGFWATGNCGGIKDKCHGVNENVVVVAERLQKMIN